MIVDSYRFLPRSFRPFYEGRGPFPGEESPVWAPFEKRLSASRIALLTSAGVYMKESQPTFDLEREDANPEWGDPTWRVIPATARPEDFGDGVPGPRPGGLAAYDGAGDRRAPARGGRGRPYPRARLTRLLLERARAGTMDRGGWNPDRGGDDDARGR
ncbi:MAG: hypothetical protein E6I29_08360 [Chloroflexi bacterium]|nr:MAG: hypothetical protein E6I29_08360 [Chloroflexota bacterium]